MNDHEVDFLEVKGCCLIFKHDVDKLFFADNKFVYFFQFFDKLLALAQKALPYVDYRNIGQALCELTDARPQYCQHQGNLDNWLA